jgi:ABC-type bacteriocin/lantibiotic exporter with double-glycine peptidase domain
MTLDERIVVWLLATAQEDEHAIERKLELSALGGTGFTPSSPVFNLMHHLRGLGADPESAEVTVRWLLRAVQRGYPVIVPRSTDGAYLAIRSSSLGVKDWFVWDSSQPTSRKVTQAQLLQLLGRRPSDTIKAWLVRPAGAMSALVSPQGQSFTPLQRLMQLARLEREDILSLLIYTAVVGSLSIATPLAAQALVGSIAFGTLLQPLVILTMVLGVGLLLVAAIQALQVQIIEHMQRRLMLRMADDLSWRMPRLQTGVFGGYPPAEMLGRMYDIFIIQKSAAWLLLDGLSAVLTALVAMILLASYHPILLAFDVAIVLIAAAIFLGFLRGGIEAAHVESNAKHRLLGSLQELGRYGTLFRNEVGVQRARTMVDDHAQKWLDSRERMFSIVFRQISGSLLLQAAAGAALLGVGGFLVMREQLTLGQLVAAEIAVSTIVSSIAKLGRYMEHIYDLLAATKKVGTLIDLPLCSQSAAGLPERAFEAGGALELRDLKVKGMRAPTTLTLTVEPGASCAITGPSSSGRSRLLSTIAGLAPPEGGTVRVDGIDIRDASPASWAQHVWFLRETALPPRPLLDWVSQSHASAGASHVREVLNQVGLGPMIERLPEGLNTQLTTGFMSHSERIRLDIARALIARPRVVLLDDELDSLDEHTRQQLMDLLCEPLHGWTLVVATVHADVAARCEQHLRIGARTDAAPGGGR